MVSAGLVPIGWNLYCEHGISLSRPLLRSGEYCPASTCIAPAKGTPLNPLIKIEFRLAALRVVEPHACLKSRDGSPEGGLLFGGLATAATGDRRRGEEGPIETVQPYKMQELFTGKAVKLTGLVPGEAISGVHL